MTTSTSTLYTARFELPTLMQRSTTGTIRLTVYRGGLQIVPTSGVVTVARPNGDAFLDAVTATIAGGGTASRALGDTTGEQLSDGWVVTWVMAMPDGETHTFRNDGALVRDILNPVITELDLFRRYRGLDPTSSSPISIVTDYSGSIDEAWVEINHRLIEAGRRPWLIVSSSALRKAHLELTLSYVFDNLGIRGNDLITDSQSTHRAQYEAAWSAMSFNYDTSEDGRVDDPDSRTGASSGTLWTSGKGWGQTSNIWGRR